MGNTIKNFANYIYFRYSRGLSMVCGYSASHENLGMQIVLDSK